MRPGEPRNKSDIDLILTTADTLRPGKGVELLLLAAASRASDKTTFLSLAGDCYDAIEIVKAHRRKP